MNNKKSQVALEFIIIASIVAISFVIATSSLFLFIKDSSEYQEKIALKNVGDVLFKEVSLARNVQDNYIRYFTLPKSIEGIDYDIIINDFIPPFSNNSEVVFIFPPDMQEKNYEKVIVLSNIDVLSLTKSCNEITKIEGKIKIRKISINKCYE